jgi:hypothetical protein
VPDCRLSWDLGDDGYLSTLWLLAPDSWACVQGNTVRQAGPRRLFDEVRSAYFWWQHARRPHRDRYGVTITADCQWVWLDDSTQPVIPIRDPRRAALNPAKLATDARYAAAMQPRHPHYHPGCAKYWRRPSARVAFTLGVVLSRPVPALVLQWPASRPVWIVVPDVLALECGGDAEAFVGRSAFVVPERRGLLDAVPEPLGTVLAQSVTPAFDSMLILAQEPSSAMRTTTGWPSSSVRPRVTSGRCHWTAKPNSPGVARAAGSIEVTDSVNGSATHGRKLAAWSTSWRIIMNPAQCGTNGPTAVPCSSTVSLARVPPSGPWTSVRITAPGAACSNQAGGIAGTAQVAMMRS